MTPGATHTSPSLQPLRLSTAQASFMAEVLGISPQHVLISEESELSDFIMSPLPFVKHIGSPAEWRRQVVMEIARRYGLQVEPNIRMNVLLDEIAKLTVKS